MAKEATDLTTIDLFSDEKRPGRPKTNPLPRNVQIKINNLTEIKGKCRTWINVNGSQGLEQQN